MSQPKGRFERWGQWAIVLGYAAIVLGMVPFHEAWRNEGHHWLYARDLGFLDIIRHSPYIGHPPLWCLLQHPLAATGCPPFTLGLLTGAIAIAAIALFTWRAPFSLWQKAAVVFSLYFVLPYGMQWNHYCLVMLAFFLVAAAYRGSQRRPLRYGWAVVLLAASHTATVPAALAFGAAFLWEWLWSGLQARRNAARGETPAPGAAVWSKCCACLVMGAGIGAQVFCLLPPADRPAAAYFYEYGALQMLSGIFLYGGTVDLSVGAVCLVGVALLLWELRRAPGALVATALTLAAWCYIWTFKILGSQPSHTGLAAILIVVALWIVREVRPIPTARVQIRVGRHGVWRDRLTVGEGLVFVCLGVTAVQTPATVVAEIRLPFSGGQEMAEFLVKLGSRPTLASFPSAMAHSVLMYLPGWKTWQIEVEEFGTYTKETAKFETFTVRTQEELLAPVLRAFPGPKPWLLLGMPLPRADLCGYELVHQSPRPAWGFCNENFWLYRPIGGR